jgi:hypothetical protein
LNAQSTLIQATNEQEFVMLLSDMLTNVRTVDDLYFFFDKTLPELKQSLTNLQLAMGTG